MASVCYDVVNKTFYFTKDHPRFAVYSDKSCSIEELEEEVEAHIAWVKQGKPRHMIDDLLETGFYGLVEDEFGDCYLGDGVSINTRSLEARLEDIFTAFNSVKV